MNINLTLFGQMAAFVCFVMFCMKYVWPPILAAMQERTEKIADGLAAADRASHDLELAQEKAVERLKEAKVQASGIVDAANKRANQIVDEAFPTKDEKTAFFGSFFAYLNTFVLVFQLLGTSRVLRSLGVGPAARISSHTS